MSGPSGFASVTIPVAGWCTVHECAVCKAVFTTAQRAKRHVDRVTACVDAAMTKTRMALVKARDIDRQRHVAGDAGHVDNSINNSTVDNSTHNNTTIQNVNIIVTGSDLGDLVKSGSLTEGELIRRTILENADLRRMVRVVENAPGAIFRMTRGTGGPRLMRNVKLEGARVAELTEGGVVRSGKAEYCKKTAVELVDHLQRALASVGPDSPPDLREWAADVCTELRKKLQDDVDYVRALTLYRDASSRFYKLPAGSREAIAENVKGIRRLIAGNAAF